MLLILLSNWDNGASSLVERLGLAPYFDDLLISAELGMQKKIQTFSMICYSRHSAGGKRFYTLETIFTTM